MRDLVANIKNAGGIHSEARATWKATRCHSRLQYHLMSEKKDISTVFIPLLRGSERRVASAYNFKKRNLQVALFLMPL